MVEPREGEVNIQIGNSLFDSYQNLKIEKRLNEVDTFEFTAFITDDTDRSLISEGQDILVFEDQEFVFKGRIEDTDYSSSFEVKVEGEGMATKLLDRKTDRDSFDNTPADQITQEIIPLDTVSEGVIEAAPLTSLSFDHDNIARAVAGAANAVGYDWQLRQEPDDDYETDYLDFVEKVGVDRETCETTVFGDTNLTNFQFDLNIEKEGIFNKFVLESGITLIEDTETGELATGTATISVFDGENNTLASKSVDYEVFSGNLVEFVFNDSDYTRQINSNEAVTVEVQSDYGISTGDAEIDNSVFNTPSEQTVPTHNHTDGFENICFLESPVEFAIGDNARLMENEQDDGFVANDITLLGRGDGINQLEARVFAAANDFTQLQDEISEEETDNFTVDDTTVLGDTDDTIIAKVGAELINCTIEDATTLSINERGVENWENEETPQILHRENISVWLYENITQNLGPFTPENQDSAQEGSSIADKGVKQLREPDKTLVKLPTLEQVADRELRNRFRSVQSVRVRTSEPRIGSAVELGDEIEVVGDLGTDLAGEYRVVGIDLNRRSSEEGTELVCANRPRRLVERLSEIERDRDTLNAHMQGATNFNSESFGDNCDEDNPLRNNFYVPDDVIQVNKFEVVFKRESFRGYVQNEAHSHSLTIELDDHDHTVGVGDHSHEMPSRVGAIIEIGSALGVDQFPGITDTPDWVSEGVLTISGPGDFIESAGIKSGNPGEQHTHVWPQSGELPADLDIDSSSLSHTHNVTLAQTDWIGNIDFSEEGLETTQNGGSFTTTSSNSSSDVTTATADNAGEPVYI